VTRLSGQHQIILGYEFLKEFNPQIDWTAGTLRISDNETIQAIITKRIADVKHLSGKQMSRLLKKKILESLNKISKHYITNVMSYEPILATLNK
jgi:hypothetical protein